MALFMDDTEEPKRAPPKPTPSPKLWIVAGQMESGRNYFIATLKPAKTGEEFDIRVTDRNLATHHRTHKAAQQVVLRATPDDGYLFVIPLDDGMSALKLLYEGAREQCEDVYDELQMYPMTAHGGPEKAGKLLRALRARSEVYEWVLNGGGD